MNWIFIKKKLLFNIKINATYEIIQSQILKVEKDTLENVLRMKTEDVKKTLGNEL